jgi:hypothetical protein
MWRRMKLRLLVWLALVLLVALVWWGYGQVTAGPRRYSSAHVESPL